MNARVCKRRNNFYIDIQAWNGGERTSRSISVRKELGLTRPAKHKEAKDLLVKIMDEYRRGVYVSETRMLLETYVEEWLKMHNHSIKPTTASSYKKILTNHVLPELGQVPLPDLTGRQIKTLYAKLLENGNKTNGAPLANRTVQYIHTVLKAALESAVKEEILVRNVAKTVTPPRVQKVKVNYWQWPDAEVLLRGTVNDRYHIYYCIALSTGMGRGEILGLRWQDIDFDNHTLTIRQTYVNSHEEAYMQPSAKTSHRLRTLDISPGLVEKLLVHREKQEVEINALGLKNHGLVIATSRGNPLLPSSLDRALRQAVKRLKLPHLSSHGLRHTYATRLLEKGVNPKVVAERLGHSSINITMDTYSHVTPRLQKSVALTTDDLFKPHELHMNFVENDEIENNGKPEEARVH